MMIAYIKISVDYSVTVAFEQRLYVISWVRLVVDEFSLVLIVQEQEDLNVAQKGELHSFLQQPLLSLAICYL